MMVPMSGTSTGSVIVLSLVGSQAFLSVMGAHLLFNMREAAEKGLNQGTSCPTQPTINEIHFLEGPDGGLGSREVAESALAGEGIELDVMNA